MSFFLTDDVEALRKILKAYDDGLSTAGEVGFQALQYLLKPHLDATERGEHSCIGTSWCGVEPPPPRKALLEVGVAQIWFTALEPKPKSIHPIDPRIIAALKDRDARTDRYGEDLLFLVYGDLRDTEYVHRWMPEHREGCDLFRALSEEDAWRIMREVLNEPVPRGYGYEPE
jgi:hypothetical protein